MSSSNSAQNTLVSGSDHCSYFEIKNSPIQGKGLFSQVSVARGTTLFTIKGERNGHVYDPFMADQNPNWIGIGYENWIVLPPGHIGLYINHSCKPNVIITEQLHVLALAPIKANEELLLDYSTTELDPYWKMNCNCGAAECRKVLRSFQFLPPELQMVYQSFISPSFTAGIEMLAVHQRAS
jgi:hypothetical protein